MELKVALPNPKELEAKMFFAQMRIALKAAEKTYEEAVKNLTEEEKESVYINYEHPYIEFTDKQIEDGDDHEIELRISY